MWRWIPKSWFPSRGDRASARPSATEQFEVTWRELLVAALSEVCHKEDLNFVQAIALLPALGTDRLLAFDRRMRVGWYTHANYPVRAQGLALATLEDPIEGAAHLFTASCHGNGFIRERALLAFEHSPGVLALVAALIRCDDWVPAVRQAAVRLLIRLVDSESAELLFDQLPLLLRLQQRQRIVEQAWPQQIEPTLRSPRFRQARWRSTLSTEPIARAFAYRLVLDSDPDRSEEVLRNACADLHPRVALWGLANLIARLDVGVAREVLKSALRHKNAAVRADAVRKYAALEPADLRSKLDAIIFDGSRGPRDAAAYLLMQLFHVSALQSWRLAIDLEAPRRVHAALAALSYVAEPEDAGRLVPFLQDSSARMRAMALLGLARTKSPTFDRYVQQALNDSSGLVVRCALKALSREGQLLGLRDLANAYLAASSERVRRQLIRAARLLGKWDALAFLLPLLSGQDSVVTREEIDRWLQAANRRFTALDSARRSSLQAQLAETSLDRRDRQWRRLDELLSQS
jgi:hypothetical protein